MKILISGCQGQVGWELMRALLPLGDVVALSRRQFDLTEPEKICAAIRDIGPDVLVNAAAYTAVDQAEQESELAQTINASAPGWMAEEMKKRQGLIIHYSTDYVFDGCSDRPYRETDSPKPINVYGKTKLAGEMAIRESGADHVVLRTSWVYAARGRNFLKTILRLAAEREELSIVADQNGSPTWARLIAETSAHILKQSVLEKKQGLFESDLYHLTSSGATSWHGFAEAIIAMARQRDDFKVKTRRLEAIPTSAYPLPAQRPLNSRLDVSKLEQKFGLHMPHWQDALSFCLQEV
ncbi:dTDP-4-dehydrorhamnose reductase [Methylomarinum sp. Ch1-1]|uniref:dTDP-4-dehydrorhamnose reductase n=1 Tax=Methylomarinum roseum TaxID=3067653 RepID=A0AAU7P0L3_9GAMM